eukprot:scaffold8127_cov363-Prasinococcus_capsulatus_cf.AAC.1
MLLGAYRGREARALLLLCTTRKLAPGRAAVHRRVQDLGDQVAAVESSKRLCEDGCRVLRVHHHQVGQACEKKCAEPRACLESGSRTELASAQPPLAARRRRPWTIPAPPAGGRAAAAARRPTLGPQ